MLTLEMGKCPISNEEGARLIGRFLGDPRIDKSTERKLEAIPKFSGSGSDLIGITDFLDRVAKVARQEPNLTKIYFLKLRLDGFLQTTVEELETKGLTFDEICAKLKRKYSR